jgi:hypothetical protein
LDLLHGGEDKGSEMMGTREAATKRLAGQTVGGTVKLWVRRSDGDDLSERPVGGHGAGAMAICLVRVVLEPIRARVGRCKQADTARVGQTGNSCFFNPKSFPIYSKSSDFENTKQHFPVVQKFLTFARWNLISKEKLSFWKGVQIPNGFWNKDPRNKSNLNLVWILKGFKPLRKNSINSPKIFLDMIFKLVNLDWLTCIQNFEVPLQVANRA